ncbi:hypothetical protein M3Y97_00973000 [Aphelenchoides bicaudatus]|nr:hypothetical protein M3Y97_00973000 [Aphelenchoides bicaudatus]
MPPQEVNVTIDTTGLRTFVFGNFEECFYGPDGASACYPGFNRQKSISFVTLHTEEFSSPIGTGDGVVGKVDMTLGPYELTDTPAIIGVADNVVSYMKGKTRTAGFISMFAPVSPIDSINASHMQQLCAESQYPIVSLFAPRCGLQQHTVTIGKSDDTNCRSEWTDFELEPESEQTTNLWTIKFDSISWGPNLKKENVKATLSTAADYLSGPVAEVNQMRREIGLPRQTNESDYTINNHSNVQVDCQQRKNGPFLHLTAHGQAFYMRPTQYIKQFANGMCILNIYPDEKDYWTLPYMFFQGYCARFDFRNRTVGFALPKDFGACNLPKRK